jgi:hypothetical protein
MACLGSRRCLDVFFYLFVFLAFGVPEASRVFEEYWM